MHGRTRRKELCCIIVRNMHVVMYDVHNNERTLATVDTGHISIVYGYCSVDIIINRQCIIMQRLQLAVVCKKVR